jgi:hypothetical protein
MRRYNVGMCEQCAKLQSDVEYRQRAHERAVALTEGFQPMGRVSPEEQAYLQGQRADIAKASAELQEARKKLAEHKKEQHS